MNGKATSNVLLFVEVVSGIFFAAIQPENITAYATFVGVTTPLLLGHMAAIWQGNKDSKRNQPVAENATTQEAPK